MLNSVTHLVHRYLLTLLASMALVGLASQSCSTQAAELQQALNTIRQQHNIAGLYLVSSNQGVITEWALGVSDHQKRTAITPHHYVRLGSVSKLFLGLTLLKLARSDEHLMTSPISRWGQPPLTNPWVDKHPVTLAQLLEHTAGLTDMSKPEWDSHQPLNLKQALAIDPSSRLVKWPAGLHSSYSNSGAGIAAWAIEQITGQTYQDTVKTAVFEPLGLHSANYERSQAVIDRLITGYDTDGITPIKYWHTLYPAFGGVNVEVSELKHLLAFFLSEQDSSGEKIAADETTDDRVSHDSHSDFTNAERHRMHTPTTTIAARTGLSHGYGLGLYDYTAEGFSFVGHGGDADGYLTFLGYNREHQIGFFVVINAFNYRAMSQIKRTIHQHLTSSLTPPIHASAFKLTSIKADSMLGTYKPASYRFKPGNPLEIYKRDGGLFTRYNNKEQALIPVTDQHFRRMNEPSATIAITTYQGNRYFQSDEGNFIQSTRQESTLPQ